MKPLKYSEYRIQQALWLQKENAKRTNYGTNDEQFYLQSYVSYLIQCDVDYELWDKINNLTRRINSELKGFYTPYIADNITKIVDKIYDKYYTEPKVKSRNKYDGILCTAALKGFCPKEESTYVPMRDTSYRINSDIQYPDLINIFLYLCTGMILTIIALGIYIDLRSPFKINTRSQIITIERKIDKH